MFGLKVKFTNDTQVNSDRSKIKIGLVLLGKEDQWPSWNCVHYILEKCFIFLNENYESSKQNY
jgi:hypothetical protein